MRTPDFTDGVSVAFMHQFKGCLDAVPIVLHGTFLPRRALFAYPSFELMGKGGGVRSEDHTDSQSHLVAHGLRHGHRVAISRLMARQRLGR